MGNFQMTKPRRSERDRKQKRSYSPDSQVRGQQSTRMSLGKKMKKKTGKASPIKSCPARLYDTMPNGQPFCCDLCKSPYVCNRGRRGPVLKVSKYQPYPRHQVDPSTGKLLTLCNACGISLTKQPKVQREKEVFSEANKEKYMEEARTFANSLVEGLNDPEAQRLTCPTFKTTGCGCLQTYIIGNGDVEESKKRAGKLLELMKEAKHLSMKKCYNLELVQESTVKQKRISKTVGLGNGQKRSKEFEEFVLRNRKHLREEFKLCERATQRVLIYSNNFLHKKLKTEGRPCRVERIKGKAALGQLKPIPELSNEMCCIDKCSMLALTHQILIEQWRKRANSGQSEARRVLAEMLTPSGGARANCYKFISWVTGCSPSTISRVNEQMRITGGNREPPPHGLKKYWQRNIQPKQKETSPTQEHRQQQEMQSAAVVSETVSTTSEVSGDFSCSVTNSNKNAQQPLGVQHYRNTDLSCESGATAEQSHTVTMTEVMVQTHKKQIAMLQRQLAQQQVQLQQQQQLLQQQLLHQVLIDQVSQASQPTSIQVQTLQSLQQLLNLQQQVQLQQQQQLTQLQQQQLKLHQMQQQQPVQTTQTSQQQFPTQQYINPKQQLQPQPLKVELSAVSHDGHGGWRDSCASVEEVRTANIDCGKMPNSKQYGSVVDQQLVSSCSEAGHSTYQKGGKTTTTPRQELQLENPSVRGPIKQDVVGQSIAKPEGAYVPISTFIIHPVPNPQPIIIETTEQVMSLLSQHKSTDNILLTQQKKKPETGGSQEVEVTGTDADGAVQHSPLSSLNISLLNHGKSNRSDASVISELSTHNVIQQILEMSQAVEGHTIQLTPEQSSTFVAQYPGGTHASAHNTTVNASLVQPPTSVSNVEVVTKPSHMSKQTLAQMLNSSSLGYTVLTIEHSPANTKATDNEACVKLLSGQEESVMTLTDDDMEGTQDGRPGSADSTIRSPVSQDCSNTQTGGVPEQELSHDVFQLLDTTTNRCLNAEPETN